MSRSIHSTLPEFREVCKARYREKEVKKAELKRLAKALARKRSIKRNVRDERKTGGSGGAEVDGLVPVRTVETGPYIHYPATAADLNAVQRKLPRGVMDGVSEVVLTLGVEIQDEREREDPADYEADPWTGRLSSEVLTGIHRGRVYGTYYGDSCLINLYAFVIDAANLPALPVVVYLKLLVLTTFVHEVAHHFDQTRRAARGRWLALDDMKEKVERLARKYQHEWTQNCVVPYLQETYPQETSELQDWVEHYGGVRLPLGKFVSDPRDGAPLKTLGAALKYLNEDVMAGKNPNECRLGFATELHFEQLYEEALTAIQTIIHEEPENEEAWTLRAKIWVHQERFSEAEALASRLIEQNPMNHRARRPRSIACDGLEQWDRVVAVTTEDLQFFTEDDFDRHYAIYFRCRAYWKLGMKAESNADLEILQTRGVRWKWLLELLRQERERSAVST